MKKIVLHVSGISDISSSIQFEKGLKKNPKIKNAMMNTKDDHLTIICKDDLSIDTIEEEIDNLGYDSLGVDLICFTKKPPIYPIIIFGIILVVVFYLTLTRKVHLPLYKLSTDFYHKTLWVSTIAFVLYSLDFMIHGLKDFVTGHNSFYTFATFSLIGNIIYGFLKPSHSIFLVIAMMLIFLIKIGRYIEKKNKRSVEQEISQISKTKPDKVNRKNQDEYEEVNLEEVRENDVLLCLPGDKIVLDGTIVSGTTHFDESLISGESLPSEKNANSKITSGSINYENKVEYSVDSVLKDSFLSSIKKIVVEEKQKVHYDKLLDRFLYYWIPFLFILFFVLAFLNYLFTKNIEGSLLKLLLFVIASCPLSFPLIMPFSTHKNTKLANQKKIFIKKMETLEQFETIDTVIFDKTGTLTNGHLSIARVNNHSDMEEKELLGLLGSIEKHSTHALARGITKYLRGEKIPTSLDFITEDLVGYGVKAKDDENIYYACSSELLEKLDIINPYKEEERKLKLEGNTVIYLAKNSKVIATFGLKDIVRKEASKVVSALQDKGIKVILLTGDDEITSTKIAKELKIDEMKVGMNPEAKMEYVKSLIKEGHEVMMIGDGVNDAPSLACTTVGVALKTTSDIPSSAADIILGSTNLFKVLDLFSMSKNMMKMIRQNIIISLLIAILEFVFTLEIIPKLKMSIWLLVGGSLLSILLITLNTIRVKNK